MKNNIIIKISSKAKPRMPSKVYIKKESINFLDQSIVDVDCSFDDAQRLEGLDETGGIYCLDISEVPKKTDYCRQ